MPPVPEAHGATVSACKAEREPARFRDSGMLASYSGRVTMPLEPLDERHAAQILAGTDGRLLGHKFEERLAASLNVLGTVPFEPEHAQAHIVTGVPAVELLAYIVRHLGLTRIEGVRAWWVGGLATARAGDRLVGDTGLRITRSKSDVVLELDTGVAKALVGISVKTCNNSTPTNAQLYFTTASAFCGLLTAHGIEVPPVAEAAMRMFCGDVGYRPADDPPPTPRLSDPARWFWEELPSQGLEYWKSVLSERQADTSRILLSFAYPDDAIPPQYVMHQRFGAVTELQVPLAIYSVEELITYSKAYAGFVVRPYVIRKGSFKHDSNVHLAPRFGFIQFQRGGQRQHPTQLQFNLMAGYFTKAPPAPRP